jgi:hypothetical protein
MDPRIELLKAYYQGLPRDRAKVETREFGFPLLERLEKDGITLEYGELTLSGLLHKYKLANIPAHAFDRLLESHLEKRCNVCLYFDTEANSTFCFNLDNNHKENNTALLPEMEIAVQTIRDLLARVGCEPLVIASGRGYHVWCRAERPIANDRLYDFMLRVAVRAMVAIHAEGRDYHRVKMNVYPDPRTRDTVSLRLFGSEHAKNGTFSQVLSQSGKLLDESSSWESFERHLHVGTLGLDEFERALEALREEAARDLPEEVTLQGAVV